MTELPDSCQSLIANVDWDRGPVIWLTGAGISAESSIPTFRGEEGYWQVGSRNYRPQEMATRAAFDRIPDEVWTWYLYRRSVCRAATPNGAHRSLAELERLLEDRLLLVTQNVDGLHLRAGNSAARTYEIHGNIDFMRCADGCTPELGPIPNSISHGWDKERRLIDDERELLRCTHCGARTRPHVLWFDEYYNEEHFRFESSMAAAQRTPLLIVVGTTGGTTLPLQMGAMAARNGAAIMVINPERTPFTGFAEQAEQGVYLAGTAGQWVPEIAQALAESGAAPELSAGRPP